MKRLEKLIPEAVNAIQVQQFLVNGRIPKEMNGYISSMGASIISAGLLPTVIFFSQTGETKHRQQVFRAVEYILRQNTLSALGTQESLAQKIMVLTNANAITEIHRLESQIMEASVALKLAIRLYPKTTN